MWLSGSSSKVEHVRPESPSTAQHSCFSRCCCCCFCSFHHSPFKYATMCAVINVLFNGPVYQTRVTGYLAGATISNISIKNNKRDSLKTRFEIGVDSPSVGRCYKLTIKPLDGPTIPFENTLCSSWMVVLLGFFFMF